MKKNKENTEIILPELDFEEYQELYGITPEERAEMDEALLWDI